MPDRLRYSIAAVLHAEWLEQLRAGKVGEAHATDTSDDLGDELDTEVAVALLRPRRVRQRSVEAKGQPLVDGRVLVRGSFRGDDPTGVLLLDLLVYRLLGET